MSKVVLGVIAFVVLALVGLGFYAVRNPILIDQSGAKLTETVYIATSTVSYVSTTTTREVARSNTASVYRGYSGPAYRVPSLGLSVPGTYNVVPTQNIYAGVPTTASYNFYANGVHAFTVNAFSKEQWNNIRIQETMSVAEQGNMNAYFGEGRYLGENKTWIFSYIPAAYSVPTGVRFY